MNIDLAFKDAPFEFSASHPKSVAGPVRRGVIASVLATLGQWRQRTETRWQLSQLDDRALRDIGFDPEQIRLEVSKPFWKPCALLRCPER